MIIETKYNIGDKVFVNPNSRPEEVEVVSIVYDNRGLHYNASKPRGYQFPVLEKDLMRDATECHKIFIEKEIAKREEELDTLRADLERLNAEHSTVQ